MQTSFTGKLIFFTSFYEMRAYSPYIESMVKTVACLEKLGVNYDFWPSHGDFHLDRAINETLTRFMNDPTATDILMIDSDESWEPADLVRLLFHPEEIVSASYRMKHLWAEYVGVLKRVDGVPVGKMLPDGTALLEALRVPGGFTRIKKSALRRFHDAYPELRSTEQRPDGKTEEVTVFFERYRFEGQSHCHDYGFSRRWLEIGGQLWIDPNIKVNHWGMTCYHGDLDRHLREGPKEQAAFATLKQMADEIAAREKVAA